MRKFEKNRKLKNSKTQKIRVLFSLLLFILFGFLAFLFFRVLTLDKFIYVNRTEVGDAEIIGDGFKYKISADSKLDSARGYGNYKLESLWKLSEKDDKKGAVVAESVAKNYHVPVFLWKDGNTSNLNLFQRIKAFFIEKKNNVEKANFESFDLSNSISINFVQNEIVEELPKIEVEDLTGTQNIIESVSRIVEISGSKISSNSKGYDSELDCEVLSNNLKTAEIYSNLFDCKKITDKTLGDVVKIRLGGKFATRF